MTDTKQKVAELATKFFGKGGVRLYTTGLLALSAFGLTACGTMGQQGVTYAMAMPVNGGNTTAGNAQAAAQPIILVQEQPSAAYYVNEGFSAAKQTVELAGEAVSVFNAFKMGDAQSKAIKWNAKGNYNYKTAKGAAAVINAKGNYNYKTSLGKAAETRANAQLEKAKKSGKERFNPKKQSHSGRGQVNPHQGGRRSR